MATLSQANSARAEHADDLGKIGAHAIGVEKGESFGRQGWVVVVYVEPGTVHDLPAALTTEHEGKAVDVPVVVKDSEPFEAQ
ncbi:hypothetical protein [Mesorhizobium sp. INR15]|uniref:hypothetical protein n=1 Tax=Mesorhizobium sp. INR15 TaxID=2654248 RepID=UPI00189641C5|nr:hypothetical protein [Mesorhizobium sp. INR15]QPC91715.1 hypothetical protein GA829_14540 [Mesorhizobium sp. INR15]